LISVIGQKEFGLALASKVDRRKSQRRSLKHYRAGEEGRLFPSINPNRFISSQLVSSSIEKEEGGRTEVFQRIRLETHFKLAFDHEVSAKGLCDPTSIAATRLEAAGSPARSTGEQRTASDPNQSTHTRSKI
jgi:hypothetical protein